MASITRSNSSAAGNSFADRIRSLTLRIEAYRAAARQRNRILRELSCYSDDELSELGFSRSDVPAVAAGTYRR